MTGPRGGGRQLSISGTRSRSPGPLARPGRAHLVTGAWPLALYVYLARPLDPYPGTNSARVLPQTTVKAPGFIIGLEQRCLQVLIVQSTHSCVGQYHYKLASTSFLPGNPFSGHLKSLQLGGQEFKFYDIRSLGREKFGEYEWEW